MQDLLRQMPIEHRETLKYLLKHLLRVIELSAQNRMSLQNIAVLFGPNIMRSESLNSLNGGYNPLMMQNMITEFLLINFRDLFLEI